jgi:hypothetical protein
LKYQQTDQGLKPQSVDLSIIAYIQIFLSRKLIIIINLSALGIKKRGRTRVSPSGANTLWLIIPDALDETRGKIETCIVMPPDKPCGVRVRLAVARASPEFPQDHLLRTLSTS